MADKGIKRYLMLHKEYLKIEAKTAIEYRTNFLVQVISMFLNNVVWIIFWAIFFARFPLISGWKLADMVLLYSVVCTSFGLAGLLFGGHKYISNNIVEGKLDYFLTVPKKSLYHLLISKINWYDLGDFSFGIVLAFMFLPLIKIPLFLSLVIPATIIFISFGIIAESLAFYIGNAQSIADSLYSALIIFGSYPTTIFGGITKFIIFFIIPAGFISGIPVTLLNSFNWVWFILLYAFSIAILLIAIYVFYNGLKKYESGNLIGVRL